VRAIFIPLRPPCFMRFARLVIRCQPAITSIHQYSGESYTANRVRVSTMRESSAIVHPICVRCERYFPLSTYSGSVPRFVLDDLTQASFLRFPLLFFDRNLMINRLLHPTFHLPVRTHRTALNLLAKLSSHRCSTSPVHAVRTAQDVLSNTFCNPAWP
jgi:hypothetical protein